MKGISEPPMPRTCSERQVLLYSTDWEEPLPGTLEEIKISIVNDRATGSKRGRDENTEVTPYVKRSRHDVFSYSTPKSAWETQSKLAKGHPHFPARHPLGENEEQDNELDDSLLEPSDNEDDFEVYSWTSDKIDSILEDDDDDSCYAAEPLQMYSEVTTCEVTLTPLESENEGENGGYAPCKTLDVSNCLSEEAECEGGYGNYAAMPSSPVPSVIDTVEVTISNHSSVCNVKSPHEILTSKTVVDRNLPKLSDLKEGSSSSLPPNSHSPEVPLQPSILLSKIDVAVEWSEDPDIAFDCDIDNLLTISPGAASSIEDDDSEILATITAKGDISVVSDSTLPPEDLESDQVVTAPAACSSTLDVVQDLSPLSLNTPGMPKVHHHHPAEPLKKAQPFITSSLVTDEPKLNTASSVTDQNVESEKPPENQATKGMPNAESTSRPKYPTARVNNSQPKLVASSNCKAQGSSGPEKGKPQVAVAALPRPSFRAFLSDSELETNKINYIDQVLMHINSQGECNLEDPVYELASLVNQTSRENRNWQHPSDYTKRNHPRFGRKPSKCCSLNQWVTKNGGSTARFKNIPAPFQRSPIPGAVPHSS